MKTDIGIDTGDVILQEALDIKQDETCGELFERLSSLGANLIVEALELIENGNVKFISQDESKATLTKMVKKEHAKIDWNNTNEYIYNQIRAFNPAPIAFTFLKGELFKIYSATMSDLSGEVGKIIKNDNELVVACGKGSISLTRVQKAGGNAMCISDFLRGNKLEIGEILG